MITDRFILNKTNYWHIGRSLRKVIIHTYSFIKSDVNQRLYPPTKLQEISGKFSEKPTEILFHKHRIRQFLLVIRFSLWNCAGRI